MTDLIVTRGLPGSGKTTWARGWVSEAPESRVRLSRDDVRAMWQGSGGLLSRDLEDKITKVQQHTARLMLRAGKSVVVDDMNLRARFVREWADVATQCGAGFVINDDFLLVPLETCIENDKERAQSMVPGRYVGEPIIRGLYERFQMGNRPMAVPDIKAVTFKPYVGDPLLPDVWITDIDGTLAIKGDRDIYDGSKVYLDTVNQPVAAMLHSAYHYLDCEIIYMSGREDKYRDVTEQWLKDKRLPPGPLYLRETGDFRDDAVVKNELFEEHVAPFWNVLGVFDDRDRVVKMWREKGIFCAQVNYGDF